MAQLHPILFIRAAREEFNLTKFYRKLPNERETISQLIESHVNAMNTSFMATVVSADSADDVIELQPLTKRSYLDKDNVRQYVQFGKVKLRLAYQKGFKPTTKAGDYGFVIVMQSDIEPFLSGEEDSPRKYDILDGIFIPFEYATAVNTDNLLIASASGEDINITSGKDLNVTATNVEFNLTKLALKNSTDDLVDLVKQIAEMCSRINVDLSNGVLNADLITEFAAVEAKIGAFEG